MKLHCVDLGLIEYTQALARQEEMVQRRCRGEGVDTLLLLEHPPVFTLGRGGDASHLLTPRAIPVHRVSRGGDVTFHGPGQLVGYAIVDLANHGRDVHAYLRWLESVLISVLSELRIAAQRVTGLTGVWVGEKKIASIGVGVRRWITYHGFALNVQPELSYFRDIVPCGLNGVQMTSVRELLGQVISLDTVKAFAAAGFAAHFGFKEIVWQENMQTVAYSPPNLVVMNATNP